MGILRRKKKKKDEDEELEDEEREDEGLKPKKKKTTPREPKKKKPPKPWGKKERLAILFLFLFTVLLSAGLALSSREWKIPGLPRLKPANFTLENLSVKSLTSGKYVIDSGEVELIDTEIPNGTKEKLDSLLKPTTGVYGVYVIDLKSGVSWGENYDEKFEPASLNKLPVIYAAYAEDEDGRFNLDKGYSLKPDEKLMVSEIEDEERSVYKYRDLVELMGKKSDNTAFRIVRDALGTNVVNDYLVKLEMFDTSYEDNETTPKDIGKYFYKLMKNDAITEKSKGEILEILTDTIYEDYLPNGVPSETTVSHKYGREIHVINDAGIVFSENPYIIVVMSKGIVDKEAGEVIPEISRIVYMSRN